MQTFNATGTMLADLTYTGMDTVTFSGGSSYSVDGTTTVQEKNGPASATINEQGVTRSNGCCRPTAGTVTINRTGGPHPGTGHLDLRTLLRRGDAEQRQRHAARLYLARGARLSLRFGFGFRVPTSRRVLSAARSSEIDACPSSGRRGRG